MTSSCVPPTEDPTEKMERNLELLFFKEQLRLVVRSNRSRTNPWRKEGNREKEKRKFNATVIELPTIPEDKIQRSKTGINPPRVTQSQPSSQQESRFPRLCFTAGGELETPRKTSDRCNYKAWELDHDGQDQQVVISRDQYIEPSSAPDIPLSLFKEFVCAYNPSPHSKRKQPVLVRLNKI
ncbi:uncharacterized protein LOC134813977 isoform X2 [Bolinopsis microptera]|uniref:uncharacterized protein LOC134813977 isoform X2 n=1 Tax=Bolinopsis microptera TaxID=2820187 RepID=UPI003079C5EC